MKVIKWNKDQQAFVRGNDHGGKHVDFETTFTIVTHGDDIKDPADFIKYIEAYDEPDDDKNEIIDSYTKNKKMVDQANEYYRGMTPQEIKASLNTQYTEISRSSHKSSWQDKYTHIKFGRGIEILRDHYGYFWSPPVEQTSVVSYDDTQKEKAEQSKGILV